MVGYDKPLYMCAFDHRGSFEKMFGVAGEPSDDDVGRIRDAKTMIYEGFKRAFDEGGVPREAAGILVDEKYGAEVARRAKADGVKLAMPAEKSGQAEFDFEYGERFGDKIEEYDPDFTKVLVRYNPEGDREMNARQSERLRRLGEWLHERDRKFMFELLVPAERAQLERFGGDEERWDLESRPELMMRAIEELQDSGVEADIWKIEGIDDREACARIVDVARRGGRDSVSCIVLGRGASDEKVDAWLRAGSGLRGYIGFAIGRSIFAKSVEGLAAGTTGREEAAALVAEKYRRFCDVYEGALART